MALFEWVDDYTVNIDEIDAQHKRLVAMLAELHEAITARKGSSALDKILAEMVDYSKTHFATEEYYMTKYDFPGYATHKNEHDAFAAKAHELQQQTGKRTIVITMETANYLMDWLRDHVLGTDKLYAPFLNSKGVH
jgi:hemerythrin